MNNEELKKKEEINRTYFGKWNCSTCQYSKVLPSSIVTNKKIVFCKHYSADSTDVINCSYHLGYGEEEY